MKKYCSFRELVARHYSFRGLIFCYICQKHIGKKFTIDHVVPKSRGGTNKIENLRPCCYQCNQAKANHLLDELCEPKQVKPILDQTEIFESKLKEERRFFDLITQTQNQSNLV